MKLSINGELKLIETKIEALKADIQANDSVHECDVIQQRISRLASGVAVIRVGGTTAVEMTEKRHRIEDALEAVRSAQEEGIVGGGGTALLRASSTMVMKTHNGQQAMAGAIIQNACQAPIRQMSINAGLSPDIVIKEVMEAPRGHGWDFRNDKMVSLVESGIIDPLKVTRTALQNAVSCAGTLITTNYGIIQTE